VFGAGAVRAPLMLIGEQPGDREDRAGKPFVGPAGRMLDRALAEAGIEPDRTYRTNVVKHFKWKPRGKRRIHQTPSKAEIEACRPWLEAELERVRPEAVAILGATAAKALLGSGFRVTRSRGELLEVGFAPAAVATLHPSAILRAPEEEDRRQAYADLVSDLGVVA
jgi:uracil-DNA glycosylase